MAAPEATFFVFLFHLFSFHLFTTNVTRALPLETIKEEAETHTLLRRTHHLATMDLFPLSKAYNRYYKHSSARQHKQ
jgi:hypothetical protein